MEELKDKFLAIKTRKDLADVLSVPLGTLNYYCKLKQSSKCYNYFCIPKKNGELRLITAPNKQLKYIQRKLSEILYQIYRPKRVAHGFIIERNIVSNAKVHAGNRHVLNLDIENFFTSIHFGRVRGVFENEPFCFNPTISLALAQLVCYQGVLPQGAPTSPIISNLVCRALDNDLIRLGNKYKCVCTRYCDDITVSTRSRNFPTELAYTDNDTVNIGSELIAIFHKHNFVINKKKIRLQSNQSRKMVTGLVVNEMPNILNRKYRKFRAILHYASCNGLIEGAKRNSFVNEKGEVEAERFKAYLSGTINYYRMVLTEHSSKYQHFAKKFNKKFEDRFPIPCSFESMAQKYVFVLEREAYGQGTAFLVKGVGLVTCLHTVCSIVEPIDGDELGKIIEREVVVYLPHNSRRTYPISVKQFFAQEDLLILDIIGFSPETGYEMAGADEKPTIGQESYISIGYPNYAPGRSIDILREIKVRSKKKLCGQELYIVDHQFLSGASGGPVFNQSEKVIGYIDRGDENTGTQEIESAFCLLSPLLQDVI